MYPSPQNQPFSTIALIGGKGLGHHPPPNASTAVANGDPLAAR